MAHAYTPGLKITRYAVIRRQRILPLKGEVIVKKGDSVSATDVVARTHLPGKVQPINLANKFALPPEEVHRFMKVKEKEAIQKGQLLAETPGIFGFFKQGFHSPVDGIMESISKVTGQIMLREPPTPLEVNAYVSGIVSEIIPEEGVVVETKGALFQGIFGVGGEKHGRIKMAVSSPKEHLTPDKLKDDMKGCVVVGGSMLSWEAYQKASQIGIVGLVVGGFDDLLVKQILGYDLGVAITGSEDLVTTLIMTEGFGEIPMAKKTFQLLGELEGKEASLHGATQIRAGVMRPEIVVSLSESSPAKDEGAGGILSIGKLLRVIREPYFGQIGTVSGLPHEPVKIDTEAKVRILDVNLGGKIVTLPRANIELIEE